MDGTSPVKMEGLLTYEVTVKKGANHKEKVDNLCTRVHNKFMQNSNEKQIQDNVKGNSKNKFS